MSNKNLEDWEKELKHTLDVHKESTSSEDLKSFMEKLDQNDYFDQGKNRKYWKWFLSAGISIGLLSIGYFSKNSGNLTQNIENNTKIVETVRQHHSDTIESIVKKTSKKPIIRKDKENNRLQDEQKTDTSTVTIDTLLLEEKNIVSDTSSYFEESIDSLENHNRVQQNSSKKIVMLAVDTVIVKETSHKKHRKRNKRTKK